MKDQLDLRYSSKNQSEVEVETEPEILDESINAVEIDPVSKIQSSLDISLAKATKTNNIHEGQLNRSQGHANGSIKSIREGELMTKGKFERIKSMLEAELSDIQEQYFHMSLKYAEVEAEREELVMKLKEVGLVEETKRLLSEKEILSLKVESLLEKINLLESDLSSFVEKEKSTKEDISNLNGKITMFQGQVAELEHFKNNLLLENQQLGENVSSLQTTIQNLENSSSFRSADASVKESASENEELKSQIEAACTLVEKLVLENAELVEKINMLYVELDRHNAEVGVSGGAGPDSINVFPHSDGVASDTTESAEVKSVSAQESGSLQETVMNDRDYINGEQAVGLTPNSSSLSDDTGEIVQIPLDDNEVHELEPQDAEIVEQDSVPLMDAPLIGAPFRLISFVAKYVSGEDLVNQNSSNTTIH